MYLQVIYTFISKSELGTVYEKSKYDELNDRWIIPQIKPKNEWKGVAALPQLSIQRTNSSSDVERTEKKKKKNTVLEDIKDSSRNRAGSLPPRRPESVDKSKYNYLMID